MRKKNYLIFLFVAFSSTILYIGGSCTKKDNFTPKLEVNKTSISLPSFANFSDTLKISSNVDWIIEPSVS